MHTNKGTCVWGMQITTVMCHQFCVLLVATGTLFLSIVRFYKKFIKPIYGHIHLRKIQVDKNKEDTDINFLDYSLKVKYVLSSLKAARWG